MIYILLSICCSVTVAILLKLARRYKISIIQTVTWNYFFAIAFATYFFKPQIKDLHTIPSLPYIALGILLPVIFWFLAASIKNIGIVKTDIAQRLSLFIPIVSAYLIFHEQLNSLKIIGLGFGAAAIILTLIKKQNKNTSQLNWFYALAVFIGFGTIDVLFKKIALTRTIPYTSSLLIVFSIALLVCILTLFILVLQKKEKLAIINFVCGSVLGLFNFGNILFYLKAHQALAKNPSTVFAAMNIGVIILGSFIGIIVFKEKFSKINYLGLLLAIVAITIITLSQIYAI